jgi:large subunit ribosomal protein L13
LDSAQIIVVDGTDHLAGRLSSNVAKMLLKGNRVIVVNCEKIMISGSKSNIVKNYKNFLEVASILHPEHGPYHPRRPDTMIERMVRGMLPRKKPSGQTALKRLRTYIGVPSQFRSSKKIILDKAKITRSSANYTTMAELAREVGQAQ